MSRSVIAAGGVLAATLTLAGPAQADPLPLPLPFPLPFALPAPLLPGLVLPVPGVPPPAPVAVAEFSTPSLSPGNGEVVGVAQPIAVRFDESIDDRAAAERAIRITTVPPVEGHFDWRSDSQVRWRPNSFWPAGTQVSVDAGGAHSSYSIGDEFIATADDATKVITVTRNGEVVRTMPTSMGKDSTPTPNGTYYVSEKLRDMYMDSSTYGVPVDSPEGYRTYVEWATRISNSGIFVHAAPWSVWAQGNTNVSHGCLNVSTEDGRWFFENSKRGDPVVVVNTVGDVLSHGDGVGDWN